MQRRASGFGRRDPHPARVALEQLQGALNSRIVIEQAKGVVAQLRGASLDEAFVAIRDYARRTNRRLSEVAHAIVTDPSKADLARPKG